MGWGPPPGGVPDGVSTRVVLKCSSHPSVTATNTSFAPRTPRSLRDLFPLRGVEVATSGGRLLELARTRRARVCFQAQSSEQAMIRLRLCAPLARAPTPEPHVVRLIPKKTRYFSCFFHFSKIDLSKQNTRRVFVNKHKSKDKARKDKN